MIVLLLSFFLGISTSYSCDFAKKIKSVYSLSGPVTLILKDLDLLKDQKLKGISVFHPVAKKDFQGVFLPGGVFLSHETIKSFSGSVLFYDESRELSRVLSRYQDIEAIEIKTRSMTPLAVMELLEKKLAPYLDDCRLNRLTSHLKSKLEDLKKMIQRDSTFIFYLGHIQNKKMPELVMAQDGVVKWMIEEKLLKTYPSNLSYVNWSARILNNLPLNALHVGLKDSGNLVKSEIKKNGQHINLTYPGALIPGSGQVEAMLYLFKNL
jgi:hypothetical protein